MQKMDNDTSVARIMLSDDPNKISLEVLSGNWMAADNKFVIDEKGVRYTLIDNDTMKDLTAYLKMLQAENVELKLERAILLEMPIDFGDVHAIAKKKIDEKVKKGARLQSINIPNLIKEIKKEYPNLFKRIEDFE